MKKLIPISFLVSIFFLNISAHTEETFITHGKLVDESNPIAKITVAVYGHDMGSEVMCTGSIIADDLVVTAGHCESMAETLRFGLNSKSADKIEIPIAGKKTEFSAAWGIKNDITLIYFKGGLPRGYQPAHILSKDVALEKGDSLEIAGYGETSNNRADYGILRYGSAVVDHTNSAKGEVVIDESNGSGACHGDSGGPAYLLKDGELFLFGADSRSASWGSCRHLENFTNIVDHLDWIQSTAEFLRRG